MGTITEQYMNMLEKMGVPQSSIGPLTAPVSAAVARAQANEVLAAVGVSGGLAQEASQPVNASSHSVAPQPSTGAQL